MADLSMQLERTSLFADEMHGHAAGVTVRAMLPKINSLPRAQRKFALMQRNTQVHGGKRGADMRGHIVHAFGGMDEHRIAVGHETFEEGLKIAADIRVGIFLNQQ